MQLTLGKIKEDTGMKRFIFLLSVASLLLIACNKEQYQPVEQNTGKLVSLTLNASVEETKTALDGTSVVWSTGDQLNVIEVDSEGQFVAERDFSIVPEDAGKASASFTGKVENVNNTFYAIYPNIKMNSAPSVGSAFPATSVKLNKANSTNSASAIADGFDSSLSIMSAKVAADGSMVFRHAGAFIKFTVNNDNISTLRIDYDGKARIFLGRQSINLETGAPTGVDGLGSSQYYVNITPSTGTFTKGKSYLIPINVRGNSEKIGTLTFTATSAGASSSKHASFNVSPEAGKIYNLGTPTFDFTPSITATAPSAIDNDATSVSFDFSIAKNVAGGTVTVATISDDNSMLNISGVSVVYDNDANPSSGTVTIPCSENSSASIREASVRLTYHYNESSVDSDPVILSQRGTGAVPVIDASDINIDAITTNGVIPYTLDGVNSVSYSIGSNNLELSIDTITPTGISYTCTANNTSTVGSKSGGVYTNALGSTSERTATVTLSYPGAENKTITITQSGLSLSAISTETTWNSSNFSIIESNTHYKNAEGNTIISDNLLYIGDRINVEEGVIKFSNSSSNSITSNSCRGLIRFKVSGKGTLTVNGNNNNSSSKTFYSFVDGTRTDNTVDAKSDFNKVITIDSNVEQVISLGVGSNAISFTSFTWTPTN